MRRESAINNDNCSLRCSWPRKPSNKLVQNCYATFVGLLGILIVFGMYDRVAWMLKSEFGWGDFLRVVVGACIWIILVRHLISVLVLREGIEFNSSVAKVFRKGHDVHRFFSRIMNSGKKETSQVAIESLNETNSQFETPIDRLSVSLQDRRICFYDESRQLSLSIGDGLSFWQQKWLATVISSFRETET